MPGSGREGRDQIPEFYLSPRVKGLQIDETVHAAFEKLWPWFWHFVAEKLGDPGRAADLADEIAYRISRHLENHRDDIRSMTGLCRVAAMNFVMAIRKRENRIEYRGLSYDIETSLGPSAPGWQDDVEFWIWIDQLLHGEERDIRVMLHLRLLDETWTRIGKFLGLTSGQARLRFRRAIQRVGGARVFRNSGGGAQ